MQGISTLLDHLSRLASDDDVVEALKERFSEFGQVRRADRFFPPWDTSKRHFLLQFENYSDAIKVTNRYKLRSFAFNGVLIELGYAAGTRE
ncbi:MAG TPA: hypothetical protein VFW53_04685 [Gallionella sp.]|nr:hypothetical protein [Gallionella sp.]